MRAFFLATAIFLVGCGASADEATADPLSVDATPDAADASTNAADSFVGDLGALDAAPSDTSPDAGADTRDAVSSEVLPSACRDKLTAEGVDFTVTAARGVVDAVKLHGPLHDVLFASGTATTPMTDPVACDFVVTLLRFADLLKTKGFVRIGTLGSYCYRCCCAWSSTNFCRGVSDPEPDCSANGYSAHSWGRAIDVRYLYKADGTRYDVNDPAMFVKYATTETCTRGLSNQTGISRELYQLACDATAQKIFGVVLTPNYNADHRNHFHMDIGQKGTPTSWTTKDWTPLPPASDPFGLVDVGGPGADDTCGE